MPPAKQKRRIPGTKPNSNIMCNVVFSSTLLIGILFTATGCCAKIETQIKFLNDDYSGPTRTINNDASYSLSSNTQQPTVPHNDLYKSYLKRISYETIHRILRDENEPMIYRTNGLKYFRKRSSSTVKHEISKRSLGTVLGESPEMALNLTNRNLKVFSQDVVNTSRPLEEMTAIFLHNNYLKEFPIKILPNLTLLDLSQNNFTHFDLPPESYKLRFLNFNRNRIENFSVVPFNNTQRNYSIRELHLKDNSIQWLGLTNLGLLNELEVLDLSCNQIENQDTVLFPTGMKNLKYLNLAHNRLQYIYRETFNNLLSMNTLILSYNEINEINYETFLALPNLQYLDLSHNQLKGDSIRALQGIPDLVGLSIASNRELGDSMQEFVASWSLKELDASDTGLCKIPAVLAQSVRILKLADNWLKVINCGDLDSYPLLQYLDLSNSHIDEIEEDALGRLENLETLFLDNNNLKKIPVSLPTTLEHLFLQNNQIMDVPLISFQGLNNLKTLDLSSNKLIYLPDLPLPKLLTLNLQSSGINSLHQGIIKTSPHLRDLFLEDNPIKCNDLLGITEWASPCRNDRHIAKRINIKLYYVQMHNYFERFQCFGNDVDKCASCFGDLSPHLKKTNPQPSCVDSNRPIRQKTAKPSLTTKSTRMFTEERKNSNKSKDIAISTTMQYSTIETGNNKNKTTSATTRTLTTPLSENSKSVREQTNSTNKIALLEIKNNKKQLEHEISSIFIHNSLQFQPKIKSDNNYTETNFESLPRPGGNLLRQENTEKDQKGMSEQTDNATQKGHSVNNEISINNTVATVKSNFDSISVIEERNLPTPIPMPTTKLGLPMTTTTEALTVRHIPREKKEQHLKSQFSKDRHLIGTPLLMHKGHVVVIVPQSLSNSQRMTNSKKENVSHLASSQNISHTRVAASTAHKLKVVVSADYPFFYQQLSKENDIIEGTSKKEAINNDQTRIVPNTSTKNINTKFRDIENFLGQRIPKDKNDVNFPQKTKQFLGKFEVTRGSEHHHRSHSLNTPLNLVISGRKQLSEGIKDLEEGNETNNTELTLINHSKQTDQISMSVVENEDDSNTVHANAASKTFHELLGKTNIKVEGATAALIKSEVQQSPIETSQFQQVSNFTSEPWLNIRSASRHSGLVAVIAVTFAMVFVVGLFHVFRKKSFNYIIDRQHQLYQHYAHNKNQYTQQKEQHFQNHQCRHHHQLRMDEKYDNNRYCCFENKQNQSSNYGCNKDRTFFKLQSAHKGVPHNLERMHGKPSFPTGSQSMRSEFKYEFQRENCSLGTSPNTTKRNFSCSPLNYRLFQINDKRLIHHHPPPEDKKNLYMEMNHVQQTVLAADLFPMELLTAPSTMQSLSSAPQPSSLPSMEVSSPGTISPILYSDKATAIHKGKQQRRSKNIEYQELNHQNTTGRKRSKFNIW